MPKKPPKPPTDLKEYKERVYKDEPVLDAKGDPTALTMPVEQTVWQTISPDTCPALSDFLNTRKVRDIKLALDTAGTSRALKFLTALNDPKNARVHIVDLAYLHGINVLDLMQLWRSHKLTATMMNLTERLPQVATHTVDSALNNKICCNRCDGAGTIRVQRESGYTWITCHTCDGTGQIYKPGDVKNREMVFKATGIIKPDQHITNITTNLQSVESVIDELESLSPVINVSSIAIPADDS